MNKTIEIDGMMCEHCAKKVKDTLLKVSKDVLVSISDKKAYLTDTNSSDDELRKLISDLGYEVGDISNE